MDDLLDRFFDQLELILAHKCPRCIVKVSQVKESFCSCQKAQGKNFK